MPRPDVPNLPVHQPKIQLGVGTRCLCAVTAVASFLVDVLITAADFLKVPLAVCVAFVVGSYIGAAVVRIVLGSTPGNAIAFLSASAQNASQSITFFVQSALGLKEGLRVCVEASLETAMTTICLLPLASRFAQCNITKVTDSIPLAHADYPTLMEVQGRAMDTLLVQSQTGLSLAVDVKHAEVAIKDLVVVVNASGITNLNRDLLVAALRDFVVDSKASGRALQKLSSKIYSAMDTSVNPSAIIYYYVANRAISVIAFDEYALRAIEGARASKTQDVQITLLRSFEAVAKLLSTQVTSILVEATRTMATLDVLEGHLSRVQALCVEEDLVASISRGSLLSELWTALGGNKGRLLDLERRATVLQNVDIYRRLAVAHVTATMQTLLAVEEELSLLIQKLSNPEIIGSEIPLEVHVASIHLGVQRFQDERLKVRVGNGNGAIMMRTQH
ncbi:hypothetical protein GSI_08779 [Ganoderma sinense ZZ0214-1]|uniref:Uncharacterized protein n=1 Tax=Ganoderma sinense ZZ0214-1 TaxID=1077348 RepID=A0A2G8S4R6_9APHY|nr:hypothetical protein GSI_08779 [Ganoderma sinense ZZ0214-1]